jgi:hypothetical protein
MTMAQLGSVLIVSFSLAVTGQDRPRDLEPSKWQSTINLAPLLTDSARLARLVIIYRPSYRQTLFVFGTGQVVLQTYPAGEFDPDNTLLPTCSTEASHAEIEDLVRTLLTHLFRLPQREFAYTGEENSMREFEKHLREHSITVDDGIVRAYRSFAEGTYQHHSETIPPEFVILENPLRAFMNRASHGNACHMSDHYMNWRGRENED